jgi:cob(I)alamin adenosyltransferase
MIGMMYLVLTALHTHHRLAAKPDEPVSEPAIQYMNRLSDFLFVASRAVNDNGARDVLWVPGQNR